MYTRDIGAWVAMTHAPIYPNEEALIFLAFLGKKSFSERSRASRSMLYNHRAVLKKVSVSLAFGIGSAEWESDPTERRAAWSLYVELVTRIAVQSLKVDQGLLREALTSLHSLLGTTREILKAAGPDVGASRELVGGIAIAVLNNGLRPFLAKWHPLLQAWEAQRSAQISLKEHEQKWAEKHNFRREPALLKKDLEQYANALARICGVKQ